VKPILNINDNRRQAGVVMARERETHGKRRFFTLNSLKKWQ